MSMLLLKIMMIMMKMMTKIMIIGTQEIRGHTSNQQPHASTAVDNDVVLYLCAAVNTSSFSIPAEQTFSPS